MGRIRRLPELIAELRRRKVFRAVSAYCVAAWAVAQVAEVVFPAFHLPQWTVTFVIAMAILGLPIAAILSWAYDLQPDTGGRAADPTANVDIAPGAPPPWQEVPPLPPPVQVPVTLPAGALSEPDDRWAGAVPRELPLRSTPFVGRVAERAAIHEILRSEGCRLVTIIGAGGIGKTRLSLEVAREAAPAFQDGAAFIELGSLDNAGAVAPTVAEHLGVWLAASADPAAQVVEFLREKQCLLVFDNFEQVTGAADLVADILGSAPGVKAIVTSRERLKLQGEAVFPLEGLRLQGTSGDEDGPSDAVRLFIQGASLADPTFTPTPEDEEEIARIVRLVEGMPLAIELASAWIRMLSCTEIANEIRINRDFLSSSLRNVPERHRSLRAAFEGSWKMLSDVERRALRRLSVFRGGFTREAAAMVAEADLVTLAALVDKSLVRRGADGRLDVLEALRQFAEEYLHAEPQEEGRTKRLHCDYFAQLLNQYQAEQRTVGVASPLDRIALDIENVRQATYWAIDQHDFEKLAGAVDSMFAFFDVRGRAREGEKQFDRAISAIEEQIAASPRVDEARDAVLQRLRARRGVFCLRLGRYAEARQLLEQSVARARTRDDDAEVAFCLWMLATVAYETGDYSTAQRLSDESIILSRSRGDKQTLAGAMICRGNAALAQGEVDAAKGWYEESLALQQKNGRSGVWILLCNLGSIAATQGFHEEAERLFQASLAAARETNSSRGVAATLMNLGCLAADTEELKKAQGYLQESLAVFQHMGYRGMAGACLVELGKLEYLLGSTSSAAGRFRQALATAISNQQDPLILSVFVAASGVLMDDRQYRLARSLLLTALNHPASDREIQQSARAALERESSRVIGEPTMADESGSPEESHQELYVVARLLLDQLSMLESAVRA